MDIECTFDCDRKTCSHRQTHSDEYYTDNCTSVRCGYAWQVYMENVFCKEIPQIDIDIEELFDIDL